ncbi:MAG: Ig-like domain-containing protein [Rikenellaceae bacterium]
MKHIFKRAYLALPLMMALLLQTSCTENTLDAGHLTGWDEDYEYTPEPEEEDVVVPEVEDPNYVYPETVELSCSSATIDLDDETGMDIMELVIFTSAQLEYAYTTDSADPDAVIDIDKWTWESSDESILNVDVYGKITGFGQGVAQVKISYAGSEQRVVADSMLISVYYITAESVTLMAENNNASVYEGFTNQLSYSVLPLDLSFPDAPVEWSVSNELVASVDANGLVYAYSAEEKAAIETEKLDAGESTEGIDDLEVIVYAKPTDGADTDVVYGEITLTINPVNADAGVHITTTTAAYCLSTTSGFQIAYELINPDDTADMVTWSSNNISAATVSSTGYVTVKDYGEVTISAMHQDAAEPSTYTFRIPAGWWIEEFDYYTSSTISTNASNDNRTDYLFLAGNSNTNTPSTAGYMSVTTTNAVTNTESPTIDGVDYPTSTKAYRTDLWCVNEPECLINGNTYPYLVIHMDDNVAKNNVVYQTIAISNTSIASASLNSADDYSNDNVSAKFFTDDSLMLIYDIAGFNYAASNSSLTDAADSYYYSSSISFNYFMYGYSSATTVDGVDGTIPALTAFTYKLYSFQTFASLDDLETYIASLGLTEK